MAGGSDDFANQELAESKVKGKGSRTFNYSVRTDAVVFVCWAILECLAIAMAIAAIRSHGSIILDVSFLAVAAALLVLPMIGWLRNHRPITVDENEISSGLFGRQWVILPWDTIEFVVKITRRVAVGKLDRYFIRVVGPAGTVAFNSYLSDFESLVAFINARLKGRNIIIRFEDWSGGGKKILSPGNFASGQRL